jgi:hypothetical protein
VDLSPYAALAGELSRLARTNAVLFSQFPRFHDHYLGALGSRRMKYTTDPETCGKPDCWSSWKQLIDAQCGALGANDETTVIKLDCEDDAAALAASLFLRGFDAFVGVVPGTSISHAIAGYLDDNGHIVVLDPAVWHGMRGKIDYTRPIQWERVTEG